MVSRGVLQEGKRVASTGDEGQRKPGPRGLALRRKRGPLGEMNPQGAVLF